ncbi:MAG: DUF362 domain-containing protein [Verrucomicrobia bacterium]|nr:DUF362 domain-containing protein [Verrucomicrobiota bacterium]
MNRKNRQTAMRTVAAICFCLFVCGTRGDTALTNRGHVLQVCDPAAMEAFRPRLDHVRGIVERGILGITGRKTVREAWGSLVSTQDTVGIKVFSAPGPNSGTRPAVVEAVIQGLLEAGLPPRQIVVWDRQAVDLRLAGYFELGEKYGVRVAGSVQAGYNPTNYYEIALLGNIIWGDHEFGRKGEGVGRKSFVSKLVSDELTKIINISPMLNHNKLGVSGSLYSLATGSVDNLSRFEADSERWNTAIPEIYALPALSDKVVLNMTDALVCQYEGAERSLLHYSATLNQVWFSLDPVALDVLAIAEMDRQRARAGAVQAKPSADLYKNAALLELGVADEARIKVESVK